MGFCGDGDGKGKGRDGWDGVLFSGPRAVSSLVNDERSLSSRYQRRVQM